MDKKSEVKVAQENKEKKTKEDKVVKEVKKDEETKKDKKAKGEEKKKTDNGEEQDHKSEDELIQDIHLKQGNYRIHVFIEEVRSLIPPDKKVTTNPVFVVTAFGVSKPTRDIQDVGSTSTVPIGEHIFIDADKKGEEITNERITIAARDHTKLFRDGLIGLYEIDMIYVYSQPNHAIVHRWVVLSNPEDENFELMRGYLKIGVSVLHEEDKAVDLSRKENPSEKDKDLMMPPHVKPKTIQLIIQLLKAENLPIMDKGATIDAYCVARFAGSESRTSVYTADKATLSAY